MKKVLIVSPHFPPVNAPDHQRVRMLLPHLEEHGWRPHVLAVDPADVEAAQDPLLLQGLPPDLALTRVRALSVELTGLLGLRSLVWRSIWRLYRAGAALLERERFELIYFSTALLSAAAVGPLWRRRFGVPYILDFQDPWWSGYYRSRPGAEPPGGRLKYGAAQALARVLEPRVLSRAAGITSVSPAYCAELRQRYPARAGQPMLTLPFAGSERDFNLLDQLDLEQEVFDSRDGRRHWVYVGRGGSDMAPALKLLFAALAEIDEPDLRLHFVGTSYAAESRAAPSVLAAAAAAGLAHAVTEQPRRIPYFAALRVLRESSAVLIIGSDDPGYSPSKIYPVLLAGRPVLALMHPQSPALELLRAAGACVVLHDSEPRRAAEVIRRFADSAAPAQLPADCRVERMAERLTNFFEQCSSA